MRHRELIEGSRRLLAAVCSDDAVRLSANPDATPADINRCEAYLGEVLRKFPNEYSAAFVTDAQGVARCSNVPTAVGTGFGDREIFRLVRESKKFVLGAQIASRISSSTVIPAALPILRDGEFRGMCAVGISLRTFAELVTPVRPADKVSVALVDRGGASVGGDPEATRALPVATRVAAAIVGGQTAFRDYGQDGQLYEFRLLPLANTTIFVITAAAVTEGFASLADNWGGFVLVVLSLGVALLAVWLGADRWCVRPLRQIRDFADRIARGETIKLEPGRPWAPELASVGEGVKAMAEAIASREADLRASLEQRDHMLREIHHRVKNNLQMISSLLNLQAGEIRSPRIRRFFGDAQNRVLTLSILHRHLYERSSWALVDFQQFISDLVRQISVGRRGPDRPLAALSYPRADHGGRPRHRHPDWADRDRGGEWCPRPQLRWRGHAGNPHRRGRQGGHGRAHYRRQRYGRRSVDRPRRPRRLRPDTDPRTGDAAGRRGPDIGGRGGRHQDLRDLPDA